MEFINTIQNKMEYLEKVWTEYFEYKEYLKSVMKPKEDLRKEVSSKVTIETTEDQLVDLYLNEVYKQTILEEDFRNQQNRLFYTVEALKNSIEVPKEIIEELKGMKFIQIFAIKNNKTEIIDEKALEFSKEQIRNSVKQGIEQFKKLYL